MKKVFYIPFLLFFLLVSCVEELPSKEEPEVKDPSLVVQCVVTGSFSAEFSCSVGNTNRFFIGGGFYYSTTEDFSEAEKAPGLVIRNYLVCSVSDLVPDQTYYVKAYITDIYGTLESGVAYFNSPSFEVQSADYHLTHNGGVIMVSIRTEFDYSVYTDADWIRGVDTKSEGTKTRYLNVESNRSMTARSATLTLTSPDGYLRESLKVLQDGAPLTIENNVLKEYIISRYDADQSGEIELAEIPSITVIDIETDEINDLGQLDIFPNLRVLRCRGINGGQLRSVDLSGAPGLVEIDLGVNQITDLDISPCKNLKKLVIDRNRLPYLETAANEPLEYLDCRDNRINSLDFTDNISLSEVYCERNRIKTLTSARSGALRTLICRDNELQNLDVTNSKGLKRLDCSSNSLSKLEVSWNEELSYIDCSSNHLYELPLRHTLSLDTLICCNNDIRLLNISFNPGINYLDCSHNSIRELDVSSNEKIESLNCADNYLVTLNVSSLSDLKYLNCRNTGMTLLYVSRTQELEGITKNRRAEQISDDTFIRCLEDIAVIPDPVFKQYLIQYYDADGDGELSVIEAEKIVAVNICTDNVESLEGIQFLNGLKYLKCEGTQGGIDGSNGRLTSLDLSGNQQLEQVLCGRNRLEQLNVSGCSQLKTLWCFNNYLKDLDLTSCSALRDLNCEYNQIRTLNLQKNCELTALDCSPMPGDNGNNLLEEVHIAKIRIDYINSRMYPRNVANIPPQTILYVDGEPHNSIPVPFMFNYNAKNFSVNDRTFVNAPGAQWDEDLVLNGNGFSFKEDHVTISYGTYYIRDFSSAAANPFNRRGSDTITIIAKVRGTSSKDFSLLACRSDRTGYKFMFREGGGSGVRYFYLHDNRGEGSATSLTVKSLPNIVSARSNGSFVWLESHTDMLKGYSQALNWGTPSDAICFFHGGTGGEYWRGDFYWIFLSLECLSDDEIQAVINYNETL